MPSRSIIPALALSLLLVSGLEATPDPSFSLRNGDHVSVIGNAMADRLQHHGWLETYLHALYPEHELTFRNLAFPGDEITTRTRSNNFGSPDQWLTKNESDVVLCFFGYNEALRGPDYRADFRRDLAALIDHMRGQEYNGESAPRLAFIGPIAHEDLESPHLPDGKANNVNLKAIHEILEEVCREKDVPYVDLFSATSELYRESPEPLTLNGVHLLEHGNRRVAQAILDDLLPGWKEKLDSELDLEKLREKVLEKNYYWFSRYRVVDGYNVFGGRSKLAWFGQSNADVMMREMEIFDVMTANRDRAIWAVARRSEHRVVDDNIPPKLTVKTNKPGELEGGFHPYLGGEEAIEKMTVHEGLEVNLFASEEMFPEVANPVQLAVDPDGRLFVSVWPSYPHWDPTRPRLDRILCLPDEDRDGKADRATIFADELNSVTGFEFWGGGMLVAALPELWYLEDTDGDDRADRKIRMLQGLSSADTHHSANAMLIGPDGWLYWSRGIFNVVSFETPTRTLRSGRSGVYRFNPRTFEIEFHFPIGPNPHGDVFDAWGYQFANDGTSGTGSYINIGKGRGNRQWFKKRVRPVAATGILSSSHFPEEFQGNFLICNTIGVRAVLQHRVEYDGADVRAVEVDPIVQSADPNFRPSDVEIGGDGALYVSDWCNVLIGHMQHNMRDPNRDDRHGRIYRFTAKGRPLLEPRKLVGRPIPEVLDALLAPEMPSRYRARLELSGRDTGRLMGELAYWTSKLDPADPVQARGLLEALWVHEEHRQPNLALVQKVFRAAEPRVRAAAVRSLGHWGPGAFHTPGAITTHWEDVLTRAARDPSPLVRAEAAKAAVEFEGVRAAEIIFEVATRETDSELESVLKYARESLDVDRMITEALKTGQPLSKAARAYALEKASPSAILAMEKTEAVDLALIFRGGIPRNARREALERRARDAGRSLGAELIARLGEAEKGKQPGRDDLTRLLEELEPGDLSSDVRRGLVQLVSATNSSSIRRAGYLAWIHGGGASEALEHASASAERLGDFLDGLASLDPDHVETLYPAVRQLQFRLPRGLESNQAGPAHDGGPAVDFAYYEPLPASNVALGTLEKARPKLEGRLENFSTFVPGGAQDAFATRQGAHLKIERSGRYTFFTVSDDGSRLYINGQQVVDNDGLHGMVERRGTVELSLGLHEIVVTYFDNGGGDGLRVLWEGPGIRKQRIPASVLKPRGQRNLQALAIETISRWPGHLDDRVADLSLLLAEESLRPAALEALARLPARQVAERLSGIRCEEILSLVIEEASKATPVERQSDAFARQLALGAGLLVRAGADAEPARAELAKLSASIPVKADPDVLALGKEVYHRESHCVTCHQPHGQGLPNLYPPLDGSLWVTGSAERLVRLILDGLHGPIEVLGKTYSSPPLPPMTGFRHLLDDREIAAVATYVRNTWNNRAAPIPLEMVARARQEARGDASFWSAPELLERYPLEDGREVQTGKGDGWVPKFVKAWKVEDFAKIEITPGKRSHAEGQLAFNRLGCAQCHRLEGQGGNFGPDLAKLVPERRKPEWIVQSLLEPSRDVEPAYALRSFILKTGAIVQGLVVKETGSQFHVVSDPLASSKPTVVEKSTIIQQTTTESSIMPEGLLNWLTREQILDLVAYVIAGGRAEHAIYRP